MAFFRFGGVRILLVVALVTAFTAGAAGAFVYFSFLRDLPDLRSVEDYQPRLASHVLDRNGKLIAEFANERRVLVPIGTLPAHVGLAFVAAEDSAFFEHSGIDYVSILRAAWVDIRAGGIKQGASTITMQLVKQMLLSPERRFSRKFREMVLARRIEEHFTKDEILYLYLNQIYFGGGAWGIGEAARTYFAKPASELTITEAALLAGLPQRPSAYSPYRDPELAEGRRRYVLGRMLQDRFIDQAAYEHALENLPEIAPQEVPEAFLNARYFTEEVRRYLYERLGGDLVNEGGLVIETTMNSDLQATAVAAVRKGLVDHDRRQGYHGPIRQVEESAIPELLAALAEENGLLPQEPQEPGVETVHESDEIAEPAQPQQERAETQPEEDGAAPSLLAPVLPVGGPVVGVVVAVDSETDTARIFFAPDVEGQAALEDVAWAREVDPNRRPRPVNAIGKVFKIGDVAQFERLEGEPLVPPVVDEAQAPSDPDEAEAAAATPAPPLYRVTIWQIPDVEGALLSMEVETGDVRALVGGYDYQRSQFNRATQALRQPGSAFKPFIYGAALSRTYTPVSTLWDRPAVYEDPVSGFVWRPQNYSKHFYGPMPLRQALVRSVNNATVHLFRDVGVDYVIDYGRRLGIQAPLNRDLSLALGSSSVGLAELTSAYAVFPNKGRRVIPRFIKSVTDRNGQVLLRDVPLGTPPPPVLAPLALENGEQDSETTAHYPDAEILPTEQLITEAEAYLMCDLLQAVVKDPRGTGWRLRKLGRPLGGKTGTTNDQKDAWFMGFSPDIVTGVWVGRDDSKELGWGETGSRAAAPIWVDYMRVALEAWPVREFDEPEDIVTVRIDRSTGLLADSNAQGAYSQPFLAGTEPSQTVSSHKAVGDTQRAIREDFF